MANTAKQATAPVLNADVVILLDAGNAAGETANKKARDAAMLAAKTDCLSVKGKVERLEAIQALYKDHLTHPTVVSTFRAALAVLVCGEPVALAVAEKTEKFDKGGKSLKLKGMDILTKGETPAEGKCVVALTPQEAVEQLQSNDLKALGTASREVLGIARAKGAGPKAKSPVASARAPFMDEFTVALKDNALSASMFRLIASNATPTVCAALKAILEANGYEVSKARKTVKAAA